MNFASQNEQEKKGGAPKLEQQHPARSQLPPGRSGVPPTSNNDHLQAATNFKTVAKRRPKVACIVQKPVALPQTSDVKVPAGFTSSKASVLSHRKMQLGGNIGVQKGSSNFHKSHMITDSQFSRSNKNKLNSARQERPEHSVTLEKAEHSKKVVMDEGSCKGSKSGSVRSSSSTTAQSGNENDHIETLKENLRKILGLHNMVLPCTQIMTQYRLMDKAYPNSNQENNQYVLSPTILTLLDKHNEAGDNVSKIKDRHRQSCDITGDMLTLSRHSSPIS
eukprot:Filipodium_phascolosomae@DN1500_c0_g1_i1.p1